MTTIGILALQGAVAPHQKALADVGLRGPPVRDERELVDRCRIEMNAGAGEIAAANRIGLTHEAEPALERSPLKP